MRHTRGVPLDLPEAEAPTVVELDRAHGLTLEWADGSHAEFNLDELRRNCPCAECRGVGDQGGVPGTDGMTALDAQLVGGWGLSIHWSDGHQTGIYAWSILRAWAGLP
jgi:DUF971 family protein